MRQIIRVLISGLIASLVAIGITQLHILELLPIGGQSTLNSLNINTELIIFILVFALMFFTLSIPMAKKFSEQLEQVLIKYPMQEILMYIIGLAIGLYVASLCQSAVKGELTSSTSEILIILLYIGLGWFGTYLVHLKKDEIKGWISKTEKSLGQSVSAKILDTSVIIDGRILDIINTGFIEGKVIIPSFVLDELRHIADSSDPLKRGRGRRGLDILNDIKNTKTTIIEVMDIDYPDIDEVDSKLIRLAKQLQGKIVTNDFNLNKVAKLQHVKVLNINDLAKAIKQMVLPNEELIVQVIREGKEHNQGLAYLNDGTMIVIEEGKKYLGNTVRVTVSTMLQTSAGRMIFAKVNTICKE